jgi:formyl-CoA transferase
MSETPPAIAHLGPVLGADTEGVLGGWLGLGADDIAALRARGVV